MIKAVVADETINLYVDGQMYTFPKDPDVSDAQNLINCIKEVQADE